jgi:hypothetical protein
MRSAGLVKTMLRRDTRRSSIGCPKEQFARISHGLDRGYLSAARCRLRGGLGHQSFGNSPVMEDSCGDIAIHPCNPLTVITRQLPI